MVLGKDGCVYVYYIVDGINGNYQAQTTSTADTEAARDNNLLVE